MARNVNSVLLFESNGTLGKHLDQIIRVPTKSGNSVRSLNETCLTGTIAYARQIVGQVTLNYRSSGRGIVRYTFLRQTFQEKQNRSAPNSSQSTNKLNPITSALIWRQKCSIPAP
jgi:hypothetical protein